MKLGTEFKPMKEPKRKVGDKLNRVFGELCLAHGLSIPVAEYPFNELSDDPCLDRNGKAIRWRFDYLFSNGIAVECIGGIWGVGEACKACKRRRPGHHSYGKDQIGDMERRNHAQMLGYTVLEFPKKDFDKGSKRMFDTIKKAIGLDML